jgi:hypothetical protein
VSKEIEIKLFKYQVSDFYSNLVGTTLTHKTSFSKEEQFEGFCCQQ